MNSPGHHPDTQSLAQAGAASAQRRGILRAGLAALGTLALGACDRLSNSETFESVLKSAQHLGRGVHKVMTGRMAMAQEFTAADIAPRFKANGTTMPQGGVYKALVESGFATWKLEVGGLVEQPKAYTMAELRAMPSRTQITRHDCVEGWSAIGQWKGVPLHQILAEVRPQPQAKYVMFLCADAMDDEDGEADDDDDDDEDDDAGKGKAKAKAAKADSSYYESVDMDDAMHVQTILAYDLNGKPLPVANGAPLRVRIERQLGYKHAKYLMKIMLVEDFAAIRGGKGGYWEDQGYEWYAGI